MIRASRSPSVLNPWGLPPWADAAYDTLWPDERANDVADALATLGHNFAMWAALAIAYDIGWEMRHHNPWVSEERREAIIWRPGCGRAWPL